MQKITPCLWFNDQAEQAAKFYTSIFPNSSISMISHYGEAGPGQPGKVLMAIFQLNGQEFQALNGGPEYTFTPAISLVVDCKSQAEVDYYWEKLSAGGQEGQCGWLTDPFGVSWQIVPSELGELMSGDPQRAARVTAALLKMHKLDLTLLRQAAQGG